MCSDRHTVDAQGLRDGGLRHRFGEDASQKTPPTPVVESVVDVRRWAADRGTIHAAAPGFQDMNDPTAHPPIIHLPDTGFHNVCRAQDARAVASAPTSETQTERPPRSVTPFDAMMRPTNRVHDPAKIDTKRLGHLGSPPSPAPTMSYISSIDGSLRSDADHRTLADDGKVDVVQIRDAALADDGQQLSIHRRPGSDLRLAQLHPLGLVDRRNSVKSVIMAIHSLRRIEFVGSLLQPKILCSGNKWRWEVCRLDTGLLRVT